MLRDPDPVVARFLAVVTEFGDDGTSVRLCWACVAVLAVQRAAIVLHSDADGMEVLCTSDELAARIEAVQATVGAGPGVEAISIGGPVLVADLTATGSQRWPALIATLDSDTPGGMFAFPLQVGAIRLGVLDLYRDTPQPPSSDELKSMTVVAHLVTMMLLGGVDSAGNPGWEQSPDSRAIHQATGMVMAQLGVTAREAYLRLQGHAFADGRLLAEISEDIVARRLRLSPNGHDNR